LNWLDIVLIVMGIGGLAAGIKIGLFQALLVTVGMVLGVIAAAQISEPLAQSLTDTVGNESLASGVAYAIILVAILTTALILGGVVKKALGALFLGWLDNIGGAALGLATGALAGAALLAVLARLAFLIPEEIPNVGRIEIDAREKLEETLVESDLVPYYLDAYQGLPANAIGSIPGDFEAALDELQERIDAAKPRTTT